MYSAIVIYLTRYRSGKLTADVEIVDKGRRRKKFKRLLKTKLNKNGGSGLCTLNRTCSVMCSMILIGMDSRNFQRQYRLGG